MENKNLKIAALLSCSIIALGAYTLEAQAAANTEDEIQIIRVKELDNDNSLGIFNENVIDVKCPAKPFAKSTNMRVRDAEDTCETGAAIPPPCGCEEKVEPEPLPCAPEELPAPCEVSPACPCTQEFPDIPEDRPAPCPVSNCDTDTGAQCAHCTPFDKDLLNKLQVYAYPQHTGFNLSGNYAFGDIHNSGYGSYVTTGAAAPIMVPDCGCGCGKMHILDQYSSHLNDKNYWGYQGNVITGAATPIFANQGINVERVNNPCPVTVHSSSSVTLPTKTFEKVDVTKVTGAAMPITNTFDDVSATFWAAEDINRLAAAKVIAGYPDQTFRPEKKVTRAEFASLVVGGLNYEGKKYYDKALFSDVPESHWANTVIDKGMNAGLIAGYPNGTFKPNNLVTRTEALVILGKALPPCDMDDCKADEIISKYSDCSQIPSWAKVSVAKALKANALKKSPDTEMLRGNDFATRAEIAGMLANIRVTLGIDAEEIACGCEETGAAAFVEKTKMIKYPTLKMKFDDSISAKDNQAGDGFRAYTTECISIDGKNFPAGSIVRGKIAEVIRPTRDNSGGLRIAFTEIEGDGNKMALPQDVLSAQVMKTRHPNIVSRIIKMPFTFAGAIVGNTARTVGAVASLAGNGVEATLNDFGTGAGELFQGKFKAAARSAGQSVLALAKTPFDMGGSVVSGAAGLFEITGDEVAYVLNQDGKRVAQINPREIVQVAFNPVEK